MLKERLGGIIKRHSGPKMRNKKEPQGERARSRVAQAQAERSSA
jgi:hypothetical protein